MRKFIVKRLFYSLISLVLLSLTIFLFVRLTGDPTTLLVEPGASPGTSRPSASSSGSIGRSPSSTGAHGQSGAGRLRPVVLLPHAGLQALPLPPAVLADAGLAAMAFSLLLGIPSGILAAVRVNGFWDSVGKLFALLGLSLPSFWVGLLLILSSPSIWAGCRPRVGRVPHSSCPPSPSAGSSRPPTCGSPARRCWRCWAPST